jgi:hypothetical protein
MATLPSTPGDPPLMEFYLEHEKLIKEITAHFCRRYHFSREEAEDFGSHVKLKLIDDDCSILRQHQGKSSMKTYLTVVIGNSWTTRTTTGASSAPRRKPSGSVPWRSTWRD